MSREGLWGLASIPFRFLLKEWPIPLQTRSMGKPAVLFDLDGTLTDSKPGILGCLEKTLRYHQVQWEGTLDRFIGPPVEEWAKELIPDAGEEKQAILARDYRACYDKTGWAENSVYAGIPELLEALQKEGFPLYVCTSKQEHFARRILEKFGLAPFLTEIYGDRAEFTSHSKVDLMTRALEAAKLDPATTWMVGDRKFDLEAAHANGVRVIAVSYGYGDLEELQAGSPDAICATPADVFAFLKEQSADGETEIALEAKA